MCYLQFMPFAFRSSEPATNEQSLHGWTIQFVSTLSDACVRTNRGACYALREPHSVAQKWAPSDADCTVFPNHPQPHVPVASQAQSVQATKAIIGGGFMILLLTRLPRQLFYKIKLSLNRHSQYTFLLYSFIGRMQYLMCALCCNQMCHENSVAFFCNCF